MGNLFSTKKYDKLDEYASTYTDYKEYTELDDIEGLRQSLYSLRNEMNTIIGDLQKKIELLNTDVSKLTNNVLNNRKMLNDQTKLMDANEIQLESMQKLLENKFKLYNKDLDSLLNNDKILLKKIETLNPEINNDTENNEEITDLIKSSYIESNIEYSSFINQ
jgi:hypothetical protein